MNMQECGFSVKRLQANYKGRSYEINKCEQCGLLRLFAEAPRENPRFVPIESAEFHNVVSFHAKRHEDWDISDPKNSEGDEFRLVRDLIGAKVKTALANTNTPLPIKTQHYRRNCGIVVKHFHSRFETLEALPQR